MVMLVMVMRVMSSALLARVLHKLMHDDVDAGDGDSYELPQHNQDASQEIAGIIDLETQSSAREGLSSHGENKKTYDYHDDHIYHDYDFHHDDRCH